MKMKVLITQSCLTLCDLINYNLPGSPVHGILQANTRVGSHSLLQGIFPTQGSNPGVLHYRQILYHLSHQGSPNIPKNGCKLFFSIPRTIAHQALLSMEFSRQEYWCEYPFLSLRHLPNPGIKPGSPALQTDSLSSEPLGKP